MQAPLTTTGGAVTSAIELRGSRSTRVGQAVEAYEAADPSTPLAEVRPAPQVNALDELYVNACVNDGQPDAIEIAGNRRRRVLVAAIPQRHIFYLTQLEWRLETCITDGRQCEQYFVDYYCLCAQPHAVRRCRSFDGKRTCINAFPLSIDLSGVHPNSADWRHSERRTTAKAAATLLAARRGADRVGDYGKVFVYPGVRIVRLTDDQGTPAIDVWPYTRATGARKHHGRVWAPDVGVGFTLMRADAGHREERVHDRPSAGAVVGRVWD